MSPAPRFPGGSYQSGSPKTPLDKKDLILILLAIQIILMIIMWIDVRSGDTPSATAVETSTPAQRPEPAVTPSAGQGGGEAVRESAVPPPPIDPFRDIHSDVIRVQILNGTNTQGLAKKVRIWMERNGYDVRDVGNADNNKYSTSQILVRTGNNTAANLLASKLGLNSGNIKNKPGNVDVEVDLTFIIGADHTRLNLAR